MPPNSPNLTSIPEFFTPSTVASFEAFNRLSYVGSKATVKAESIIYGVQHLKKKKN